jgi:transposase
MNPLRQFLSAFSNILQTSLFPAIEQELGPLAERHRALVETLALLDMDRFVAAPSGRGRPAHNRANILRAFVARAVFDIPHTRALLDRLQSDTPLRRICGWDSAGAVPDETVFSRAFAEFSTTEVPQRVHETLIQRSYAGQLVGHISRDATAIEAREKDQSKSKTKRPRASRRKDRTPEQMTRTERQCLPETTLEQSMAELPRACDKGCKNDSKGLPSYWIGYKLHMDVADGQVPVSCILTSASLHDSQAAIPLARMSASRVTNFYDLMDSAYDSRQIREFSQGLGHVAIIEPQRRGATKPELAPHERARFAGRTTVERVYSRLKDEFGGRFVRVRGGAKVMAHLMFGVLALTADQLLRFPDRPEPATASS